MPADSFIRCLKQHRHYMQGCALCTQVNRMIPDYSEFEDFTSGFELSFEGGSFSDDEDFETVDRGLDDVAESYECDDEE